MSNKCDFCPYLSAFRRNLTVHTRTHTGEKPYKCNQCSYACTVNSSLKQHMRTHTGEKPYKCDQCSFATAQAGALQKHVRTHTGEKPFKCSLCSYATTGSDALKRHVRTHTGEKPYKCSYCSYAGATQNALKVHSRTYTGKPKPPASNVESTTVPVQQQQQSSGMFSKPNEDPIGDLRYVPASKPETQYKLPLESSIRRDMTHPHSDIIPMRQIFKWVFSPETAAETIAKLIEKNNAQPIESKLDDLQISAMKEIITFNSFDVKPAHISALDVSMNWSVETIVPVLRVFCVALLNESLNRILCSTESTHEMASKRNETIWRLKVLLLSDPPNSIRVLCCGALGNAIVHEPGKELLMTEISTLSKLIAIQLSVNNDSLQIAAASALCNFALLLFLKTESGKFAMLLSRRNVLEVILSVTEKVDSYRSFPSVALIRLLRAIATLMWGNATVIGLAKNRGILSIVNKIKDCVSDDAVKAACRDIIEMVHSV